MDEFEKMKMENKYAISLDEFQTLCKERLKFPSTPEIDPDLEVQIALEFFDKLGIIMYQTCTPDLVLIHPAKFLFSDPFTFHSRTWRSKEKIWKRMEAAKRKGDSEQDLAFNTLEELPICGPHREFDGLIWFDGTCPWQRRRSSWKILGSIYFAQENRCGSWKSASLHQFYFICSLPISHYPFLISPFFALFFTNPFTS